MEEQERRREQRRISEGRVCQGPWPKVDLRREPGTWEKQQEKAKTVWETVGLLEVAIRVFLIIHLSEPIYARKGIGK